MIKSENKLLWLFEIIRRDSGVNNAIDAIEQLSLFIFLKIFHSHFSSSVSLSKGNLNFRELFYGHENLRGGEIGCCMPSSFLGKAVQIILDIGHPIVQNELAVNSARKAESLLKNFSFKIRSHKIFDAILSRLDDIDLADINAEDYDFLIDKMVQESSSSGAFYTPTAVVRALSKVIEPIPGQTIYDPALGTGGFMVETKKIISKYSGEVINNNYLFYGKDNSPFACLVCSLRILLNGFDINSITVGDSLIDVDDTAYDLILTAPPFGNIEDVTKYQYEYDGYAPRLELMFLKLLMQKLKNGGRAAVVVPDDFLSNANNSYLKIKHELLTKFNLHTILSLPSNTLFPYSGIKISVLFFEKNDPGKDIWIYRLSTERLFSKTRKIRDEDLVEFVDLFKKRSVGENSYIIDRQEILDAEGLNLSFRFRNDGDDEGLNRQGAVKLLKDQNNDFGDLLSRYIELLSKDKINSNFKKITLGDILKPRQGRKLNRSQVGDVGDIPVYGANGIIGYSDVSNFDGENILIGRVGSQCGNVYYTKGPIWVTENSFIVELHYCEKVHVPYLEHVLRSLNLKRFARGSAQPSLSFSKFENINVHLPSYEDQVELAKWFKDIRMLEKNLRESLQVQDVLLSQLTESFIADNCSNV